LCRFAEKEDPFSRGFICPKAYGLKELYDDPDRLRQPVRHTATGWEEITWDEAYTEVASRLLAIREKYGNNAIGMYTGNPIVHDLAFLYVPILARALASRSVFNAAAIGILPNEVQTGLTFGGPFPATVPVPDIDRTHYLLIVGANPATSHGNLMTMPDAPGRLKAVIKRGGKSLIIDPPDGKIPYQPWALAKSNEVLQHHEDPTPQYLDPIDLEPLQPRLREIINTKSGLLELTPPTMTNDLTRPRAHMAKRADSMVRIGRRNLRTSNSFMHNLPALVKGRDRCTLQISRHDAARIGLTDGGSARITSRVGRLVAPVEVTEDLMPGVISLPHGWGHDVEESRLTVAKAHAGVNTNILTDDRAYDEASGTAVLFGTPVTVEPVTQSFE
jgi:anaerobic selenocysteine-containing dehydrogenase